MVQGYVLARPELAPTSFRVFSTPRPVNSVETGAGGMASEPVVQPPLRSGRPVKAFGRRASQ